MNKTIKNILINRHKMHIAVILCLLVLYVSVHAWAQQKPKTTQNPPLPTAAKPNQNKKLIVMKQADYMDKRLGSDAQILIDNVVLYHDGAFMYCDSAYLNEADNTFQAFGTVRVEQGDTLFLYCSYLEYEGDIQLLKARNNVRLVNKDVTLFTDSLNYDRLYNIGYYFDGGMLVDSLNELTSYWGQYEPSRHMSLFKDSVKLTNDKFVMFTDTLLYDTESKIATILGPTRIESDSATIYSTRGWYNTNTEESLLLDRSRVVNIEGNRILVGDSIFYNRKDGYGEVFGNMFLQDTAKKVILQGNYGYYNDITDFALASDSAFAIEYSQPDSLFIHADTLSLSSDSTFRTLKAYYGVRFFRNDLQGVCDSLQFETSDSILHMYRDPVLWNEANQIYGDVIDVMFNDSTIDRAHVSGYAFSVQQIDSVHFNQLKGRDMMAYFENGDINHILVSGNAESIFYPEEEDKSMIGMNQTQSSYLSIDLKNKKIEKLKLWPTASGTLTPLSDWKPDMGRLKDFAWYDYLRPLDRYDIFREVKKKAGTGPQKRSARFIQP